MVSELTDHTQPELPSPSLGIFTPKGNFRAHHKKTISNTFINIRKIGNSLKDKCVGDS